MRRQVEDQLGPSFSRYVHRAASPDVKPESLAKQLRLPADRLTPALAALREIGLMGIKRSLVLLLCINNDISLF
jgi:hypothetical protein